MPGGYPCCCSGTPATPGTCYICSNNAVYQYDITIDIYDGDNCDDCTDLSGTYRVTYTGVVSHKERISANSYDACEWCYTFASSFCSEGTLCMYFFRNTSNQNIVEIVLTLDGTDILWRNAIGSAGYDVDCDDIPDIPCYPGAIDEGLPDECGCQIYTGYAEVDAVP